MFPWSSVQDQLQLFFKKYSYEATVFPVLLGAWEEEQSFCVILAHLPRLSVEHRMETGAKGRYMET